MYCIDVKTAGDYHNVVLGKRYAFSKRKAKNAIKNFLNNNCEIEVTKFIKCADIWCWSNDHDLYGGIWEPEE